MTEPPSEARTYFEGLFSRAFEKAPFSALCTLLRVDGVTFWDPFEESRAAFDDYNWMLQEVAKGRGPTARFRVALLMYCQAVEMDAAHELLFNLVRTVGGHPYTVGSMGHLWRRNKRTGRSVPPSATTVFKAIRRLSDETGETQLTRLIDTFFGATESAAPVVALLEPC